MIKSRRESEAATVSHHASPPPMLEALEPRLLLSAGCLPGLVGADGSVSHAAGQVVHLDFDGQEDVDYNGPVEMADIDVPAFSAPELAEAVAARVAELLSPLGVQVITDAPTTGEYSTIYIGGTGAAFAAYGSFDGLVESVDVGNAHRNDIAFVFSDNLTAAAPSAAEYARSVAAVAAHEAGHLLGLAHSEDGPLGDVMAAGGGQAAGALAEVAHESAGGKEVHQAIIVDAGKLYDERFAGSEAMLGQSQLSLVQGTRDQDCFDGVNPAAGFDNPFSGRVEYGLLEITQHHFCEGADGNELTDGLMHYSSAFTDAIDIFYSLRNWDGPIEWYQSGSTPHAYYYLGHVAHLLGDMTTPVHVHNDAHPGDSWDADNSDNYEIWVGWNYALGYQPIEDLFFVPGQTVFDEDWYKPALSGVDSWGTFEQLFRLTTDYTDDYCSDDYDGDHYQGYGVDFRVDGAHIPTLDPQGYIFHHEMKGQQCLLIARDLMPWAVERTAVLFRFFYRHVDAAAPTVTVTQDLGLSTDSSGPTVISAWQPLPAGTILGTSADPGPSGVYTSLAITHPDGTAISGVDPITCTPTANPPTRTFDAYGRQTGVTVSWEAAMTDVVAVLAGLGAGDYRIRFGAEDGGGNVGQMPADFFVTFSTAPVITDLTPTPGEIDENDSTLLEGALIANGGLPCTVDIDWGDGSAHTTLDLSAGVFNFSAEHQYLDDPPGTSPDVYPISVTVTNADGSDEGTVNITVSNVAPVIADLSVTSPIDEDGTATLTAELIDPGTLDAFVMTVDWGDGNPMETFTYPAGTTAFSETHQYLDDNPTGTPQDDYIVTVTVTDDDSGTDSDTTTVKVLNVDPVIETLTTSAPGVGDAFEGDEITVTGTFTDIGAMDTHSATIDWGDATVTPAAIVQGAGGGSFSGNHVYTAGGVYTVTVVLTDDDSGQSTDQAWAVIGGAGVVDHVLYVIGTDADDRVAVNAFGKGHSNLKVHASFLPDRGRQRDFSIADDEIEQIVILCGDGDDHATLAGNVSLPAVLDGGAGDERLKAAREPAVRSGAEGLDVLIGDRERDLLIGGEGRDRLVGGAGGDILIRGFTAEPRVDVCADHRVDRGKALDGSQLLVDLLQFQETDGADSRRRSTSEDGPGRRWSRLRVSPPPIDSGTRQYDVVQSTIASPHNRWLSWVTQPLTRSRRTPVRR